MSIFELISRIRSCGKALMQITHIKKINLEDEIMLKVIEKQLFDMAKKYNPEWFEPIE